MEDFLNRNNSRNYQNSDYWDYNCGGFALETFSWYQPLKGYDATIEFLNEESINFGATDFLQLEDHMTDYLFRKQIFPQMMEDFKDRKLRRVKSKDEVNFEKENLIALRIGIEFNYDDADKIDCWWANDFDFHFRLYNPKTDSWFEKCGHNCPRKAPSDWCVDYNYNSDTYYFAIESKNPNLIFDKNCDIIIMDELEKNNSDNSYFINLF